MQENSRLLAAIAVLLVTILMGWLAVARTGYGIGAVAALLVIELLLAGLLHGMELWLHAVLVLVEILAGVILEKTTLILLCVVVYIVMTIAQQIPGVRER